MVQPKKKKKSNLKDHDNIELIIKLTKVRILWWGGKRIKYKHTDFFLTFNVEGLHIKWEKNVIPYKYKVKF